jgi:hypothetical protein
MILLNFSHPLTSAHLRGVESLTGQQVERVVEVNSQIDTQQPLVPQVIALADACGLTAEEWQTLPLLVNPPSLNFTAVTLLAELHGRMGYFPTVLRMRPVPKTTPPRFEVAELIDLLAVRDASRDRRAGDSEVATGD